MTEQAIKDFLLRRKRGIRFIPRAGDNESHASTSPSQRQVYHQPGLMQANHGPYWDSHQYCESPELSDERRVNRVRRVAALRGAVGVYCLLAPRRVVMASEQGSPAARRAMQILGGRHVLQAGAELARPSPVVLTAGAMVDAVHAIACLCLAVIGGRSWRQGMLFTAATATGFGASAAATSVTFPPHIRSDAHPSSRGVPDLVATAPRHHEWPSRTGQPRAQPIAP
jgi:hypothetical protein